MSSHLVPCPSCSRHVRVREESCPHCGTPTSEEFRSQPAPRAPTMRLNRAALYAVGAGTIAVAAAACSSSNAQAIYGAPEMSEPSVEDAAMGDEFSDLAQDGAPVEASFNLDANTSEAGVDSPPADGGADAADSGTGIAPPYGLPPADSGM